MTRKNRERIVKVFAIVAIIGMIASSMVGFFYIFG